MKTDDSILLELLVYIKNREGQCQTLYIFSFLPLAFHKIQPLLFQFVLEKDNIVGFCCDIVN